jgi:hypothetical protein
MSEIGQWLFQKQLATIKKELGDAAATLVTVDSLPSAGRITVLDPLTDAVKPGTIQVLGPMPVVGQRVLQLTLSDGEKVAVTLAEPGGQLGYPGGAIQGGRALFLTTVQPLGTLSGVTLTANRLYYVPVYAPERFTATGLLFEVTTVVSGEVQMALYESTASFLPGDRIANGSRVSYGALGVKTQNILDEILEGGRWYFVGICSKVAMAIRGSTVAANLPSLRGGSSADMSTIFLIANQDLTAGWTDLPAAASSPSSGPSNTYLHVGVGS